MTPAFPTRLSSRLLRPFADLRRIGMAGQQGELQRVGILQVRLGQFRRRQAQGRLRTVTLHCLAQGDDLRQQMRLRAPDIRSEAHTSELQSLMRISYAVFCLKKKTT